MRIQVKHPLLRLLLALALLGLSYLVVGMHYVHHVREHNLMSQLAAAKTCGQQAKETPPPVISVPIAFL